MKLFRNRNERDIVSFIRNIESCHYSLMSVDKCITIIETLLVYLVKEREKLETFVDREFNISNKGLTEKIEKTNQLLNMVRTYLKKTGMYETDAIVTPYTDNDGGKNIYEYIGEIEKLKKPLVKLKYNIIELF